MSKYYKYIDKYNIQEYTKPYIYLEGVQISNPSVEILAMAGVKPLITEEAPEYDATTHYIQPYYEEGEQSIVEKWELQEIPEEVIDYESTDA